MEYVERGDMLKRATVDLEPSVSVYVAVGCQNAQPNGRIVLSQQVSDDECAPQARALTEWPSVRDAPGTPDLATRSGRKVLQPQPLRSRDSRGEAHAATEGPAETSERHGSNQQFDHDDDCERVERREDLARGQLEGSNDTAGQPSSTV
jgi:hypothetical protein